jgi:hypothetical protein
MTLRGPDLEDKRKLHLEVNQIVNQRLTLTTLGVTIFFGVVAWLMPRDSSSVGTEIGVFRYTIFVLLTLVEFALFLLAYYLSSMLRIITTYLVVTGASTWELDWIEYRNKFPQYLGYTKPQSIIFLILGSLSAGFPFLLRIAFSVSLKPKCGVIISVLLLFLYVLFVSGMGFCGWFAREDNLRQQWQTLKNNK